MMLAVNGKEVKNHFIHLITQLSLCAHNTESNGSSERSQAFHGARSHAIA